MRTAPVQGRASLQQSSWHQSLFPVWVGEKKATAYPLCHSAPLFIRDPLVDLALAPQTQQHRCLIAHLEELWISPWVSIHRGLSSCQALAPPTQPLWGPLTMA